MRSAFDEKAAEISYEMSALMAKVAAGRNSKNPTKLFRIRGGYFKGFIVDLRGERRFCPKRPADYRYKGTQQAADW